jgi:hypothetical protein
VNGIHSTEAKWYIAPAGMNTVMVCLTQRAGSTNMGDALRSPDNMPLTRHEAKTLADTGIPVLMWIRNPYERFASACSLFGNGFENINHFARHAMLKRNAHWDPQVDLHTIDGKFLPTVIYSFDSIAETWPAELPDYPLADTPDCLRGHTWKELEPTMDPGIRAEIDRHWAPDLECYREAA